MKYLGVNITDNQMTLLDRMKKYSKGKSEYVRELLDKYLIDDLNDLVETQDKMSKRVGN